MDYFSDVYLKSINRFGNTTQSRVHGQLEHDFENKLKKSVNKVTLYNSKNIAFSEGILETKDTKEEETIVYLCTRIKDDLKNGTIFSTRKANEVKNWMVVFKEKYQTIGYNRYKVILLENKLSWIGKDGLIYDSFVHYTGSLDKSIKDQFKIDLEVAIGTPGKTLSIVCPYTDKIYRDLRINISDETWRVRGYDKISVPGVMYISLEEDYVQNSELANEEDLKKWSNTSSQGLEIVVDKDDKVEFYSSYNGVLTTNEIKLETESDVKITSYGDNKFGFDGGDSKIVVKAYIAAAPKVSQEFELTITEKPQDWIAIVGPNQIKVLQTLEYELATSLDSYSVEVTSENDCFKIIKTEGNKVYIQGINIGKDNIVVSYDGNTYLTPINVISPWM